MITLSAKQLGKKQTIFADVPLIVTADGTLTLRQLLDQVVRGQVQAFHARQADRQVLRVLTEAAIAEGRATGKFDMGDHEPQTVEAAAAVDTAWQAFADGLYFVFIDDRQIEQLDEPVILKDNSHLMFVRLVALAEADVLTPQQAQEQLKQFTNDQWFERDFAAASTLSGDTRTIAYAFLDRDADGSKVPEINYRTSTEADHEKLRAFNSRLGAARDRLTALDDAERALVFGALFDPLAQAVERGWQFIALLPYRSGHQRRPFRALNNSKLAGKARVQWLQGVHRFMARYPHDLLWLAGWASYLGYGAYGSGLPELFAAAIDSGDATGNQVFDILLASARGEHPIGGMGMHITNTLLLAARTDGWDFVESLLLAAQRQEGLRQSILGNLPDAHPDAFRRFVRVMVNHDLARFSAAINSLNGWFNFRWEAGSTTRPINEWLTRLLAFLDDPSAIESALTDGDPQTIYLALWVRACQDAQAVISPAARLLNSPDVERRFAAAHLLSELGLRSARNALLPALDDPDRRVAAQAFSMVTRHPGTILDDAPDQPTAIFDQLERMLPRFPKTATELKPILWPWVQLQSVTQVQIADQLPAYLGDQALKRLIPHLRLMSMYTRKRVIDLFDKLPEWDDEIRATVFAAVGDTANYVSAAALKAIRSRAPTDSEIRQLESWLTRKRPEFRNPVIDTLAEQRNPLPSAERLLAAKDEWQRQAGLELLRRLSRSDQHGAPAREIAAQYRPNARTDEERTLLNGILNEEQAVTLDDALGLSRPMDRSALVMPATHEGRRYVSDAALACLQALDAFIEARKETPVPNDQGWGDRVVLLGANTSLHLFGRWQNMHDDLAPLTGKDIPLADLWEQWWNARPNEQRDSDNFELVRALASLNGVWVSRPDLYLDRSEIPLRYQQLMAETLKWLIYKHPPATLPDFLLDALETALMASLAATGGNTVDERLQALQQAAPGARYIGMPGWSQTTRQLRTLLKGQWTPEQNARLWRQMHWLHLPDIPTSAEYWPHLTEAMDAYSAGAATEADVFLVLIGKRPEYYGYGYARAHDFGSLTTRQAPPIFTLYPALATFIDRCRARILEIELERGEAVTAASNLAATLRYSGGLDVLIPILRRFGKHHIAHAGWNKQHDKAEMLSHLVKVSYPAEVDTPETFARQVKAAKIPTERLIELALYAPQWAVHVERALKQTGFVEGVWWLYAHTKHPRWDFRNTNKAEWQAQVAERTPLSAAELLDGAVDVAWFAQVYKTLGPKRWQALYNAAQYATDGIGHKRAQLFASAMLGAIGLEDEIRRIEVKRHQDSVRALGLIPLAKGKKREADLLRRYGIIQEFLRTGKKFGAQRRASDALAAKIGLENLARTAGYADPLRLQWAMERRETDDLKDGVLTAAIGEVTVTLRISDVGDAAVTAEKKGKLLKSIPPTAKKAAVVRALLDRKKAISQQAFRMRAALETAMCRGDSFTAAELRDLIDHPVLGPLLNRLLFIDNQTSTVGYFDGGALALRMIQPDQQHILQPSDAVRIAHPHDLLQTGDWPLWERDCFDRGIKQPFKQVFRELYVLTPAEGETASRRYTGHQIQQRQAVALLGARGWIGGYEYDNDFHKTFHDERLVASVSFRWGYGTPAQVEAPALDSVSFARRDEWKALPLSEVPPRLFSEVMRDLDLVVSVAHVGGVDPEASASTVEMRATLVAETNRLLRLDNVRIQTPHVLIQGSFGEYAIHLGSAIVHQLPGGSVCIVSVSGQQRGRLFLPFADDDPRTAEVMSKVVLLAHDHEIKDPVILAQLRR